MTNETTGRSESSEIQFGDSTKWHIQAFYEDRLNSNDTAVKLRFLFDQIQQPDEKGQFILDLKACVLQTVSESSTDDENSTLERANNLFELLIMKMRCNKSNLNFIQNFGLDIEERVKQVTQ